MLPKKRRVDAVSVKNILENSSSYHSPVLSLRIQKDMAQLSRFSVVVSKKVAPGAVERNSIKRKVYHALSPYISDVPSGWKGVFFVKKGFSEHSSATIKQEIKGLLEKSLNISLS